MREFRGGILVITDMVGIYPSISHIEGLEVLRKQYGKFKFMVSMIRRYPQKIS